MEHYIAIDNVCAWPNLTKLPDGVIVASIFNQPCHGLWEGDVECWASADGGRTWKMRGTPAPHEPGANRMNVAAGLAANGDLLVLASGWNRRSPPGTPAGHGPPAHPLPPWVCRSSDGGRTWTHHEMELPAGVGSEHIIPFGGIVHLKDGALGVCLYGVQAPDLNNSYFYASSDNGCTWRLRGVIQEGNLNETAPLALPDGRLLACGRTLDDQHLELLSSEDLGRTWKREQAVSGAMQHPAHLLALADGRILLCYGLRGKEPPFFRGIGSRISADGGGTWSPPLVLHASGHTADMAWPASDGGYPACAQADDGLVVAVYYSSCAPRCHDRYHMPAVIWNP